MCKTCYETYEAPVTVTDRTADVVVMIGKVYGGSVSGGGCHVVLDDWNLEDDHIDTALMADGLTLDERVCLMLLREMSVDERATALAMYDGFVTVDA